MRWVIKTVIFNAVSIYLLALVFPGVRFASWQSLFLAAVVFGFLTIFVKPILKILLFPLNLLTFGLLSSLMNVLFLYMVTLVVTGFTISAFSLNVFNLLGYNIGPLYFSGVWTYIVTAAGLGFLNSLLWAAIG
ncbi:MAG: phage holin family protein [Patescibacteria group bacterium]|nr:phage holin family protein [Patescibacteria group bacterium]